MVMTDADLDEAPPSAIDLAIGACGGLLPFSKLLGVSYQAVQKWRRKVPAERVLAIEAISGVPRSELRPDLYPAELVRRPTDSLSTTSRA